MAGKKRHQGRFLSRRCLANGPLTALLPRVVTARRHAEHPAQAPHRIGALLRVNEAVAAHWASVCESLRVKQALAMAFLKSPTPVPAAGPAPATGTTRRPWPGPTPPPTRPRPAFALLFATYRAVSDWCSGRGPPLASSGSRRQGAGLQHGRPHHICVVGGCDEGWTSLKKGKSQLCPALLDHLSEPVF